MKQFLQRILQEITKKIILRTLDDWLMSNSSQWPIEPAYYIKDCRILGGDISPLPPNVPLGLKVGEHHPSHCQLFFLMHCLSNAPCVLGGTRVADDKVCEIEWVMFLCRSYVRILVISYMWAPLVTNLLGLWLHMSCSEVHFLECYKIIVCRIYLVFRWNNVADDKAHCLGKNYYINKIGGHRFQWK